MIESAMTMGRPADSQDYKSWQGSVRKTVMRLDPLGRTAGPLPVFERMVGDTAVSAQTLRQAYAPGALADDGRMPDIAYAGEEKSDGYGFFDVLDVVNPLQHLPVIGSIYRKFSGDTIKPMSEIIGGAIFGGPVGAVASTVNAIVKNRTGRDVTENMFSLAGVELGPKAPPKFDYAPLGALPGTTLALADLSDKAADGRKNFGAQKTAGMGWNA